MDYFFKPESFDIHPLVKQYNGKEVEELFDNYQAISNEFGSFMDISWKITDFRNSLNHHHTKKKVLYDLKTVYYIGECVERDLKKRGVKTLYDLRMNFKYNRSAISILESIKSKDYQSLYSNKNINDLDVAFCFESNDFLFLDIETLGIYDSPVIIVGLGYFQDGIFTINILFARDLEEEIAIFEHLRTKILPFFKCFVTYNGKTFDIPNIANRFMYFFDENPMISIEDSPYEFSNTLFHHIDLYHNCRRKYKEKFYDFSLTNMERKLLDFKRENELPGSTVGVFYRKYLENPRKYVGLIKECIEHNYWDIYTLPLIFQKLLER